MRACFRCLLLVCLYLAGASFTARVSGQSEFEPYFSLSTSQTFGPSDTPSIALAGAQVPAVQIRVYRVKDPVEFYRKIESPHNFGTEEQSEIRKNSLLGDIHSWKRNLRRQIRIFLRGQFTESVSAHFQGNTTRARKLAGSKENYFASAPVLNKDQLVLSFVQPLSGANWISNSVPIRVHDNGIYLVEAVGAGLRAYTILIKSNLVLVTKVGKEHVLGYVVNRTTGAPVANADILVMKRNEAPASFRTNSDGLADIKVSVEAGASSEELRMVARQGTDTTLNALSLWNFGDSGRSWTGYIYTDRPVYRPGDAIHFRGIIRQAKSSVGYTIPAGNSFAVQILDPEGKQVYTKHLTANSNGIIHDDFTPDRTAALGVYYVQVAASEVPMTGNFEIQDYKKPEYEVRVAAAAPRVLQGDTLEATINGRYYFGEPVKNAKVQYSIYRSRYYYPLWADPDEQNAASDSSQDSSNDTDAGEEVLKAEGQLDNDGNLHLSYKTTVSENQHDFRYRIEARVTDEGRREISGAGYAVATYGTFLVNAAPTKYFYQPLDKAEISLKAVDYDGKPVQTPVTITLERTLYRRRQTSHEVVATVRAATRADGSGTATLTLPAQGGSYEIVASALSGNEREIHNTTGLWIAGAGEGSFYGSETAHTVQIVPDQKKYAAGDTAHFLIVTGQANTPVLVTVEGRDVQLVRVMRSKTPTVSFDYKIDSEHEPGFYVSAEYIRKGEMFRGQKHVPVPPQHHRMAVAIATDKPQYQPGQTAMYRLHVTTPEGKPVAGADLSLGVVDEAIYAIRPDSTPDLVQFFYGDEGPSVTTSDSFEYYFSGEAGNRRMLLAMETSTRKALAQIKREPLIQPKVRKEFRDTSFWADDVTTDATGSAEAKVSFPDSLTTWRATVKGATAGDRFGAAVAKTVVRKNFIMRLSIPRFFVAGDETVISGIVHNYLPSAKHATVSVALLGLDILNGAPSQQVDVPSHGETRVDWRVKTTAGTQATITAKGLTNEESDALEVSVPIKPQGISIHQARGGSVTAGAAVNQSVSFPADAEPGSRSVSIRLSSSVAGSIFNALDFLTSFPYGCVEQTMSSFLPNLMVTKATQTLKGVPPVNAAQVDQQVKAGLERLYGMQHEDGGWGWWPSDASHPFMTAYVVAGFAEAKSVGVEINEQSLQKGIAWLQASVPHSSDVQPDLQAYMAYALARGGSPDAALVSRIYAQPAKLSSYGLAILGLAFESVKDSRASEIAGRLEAGVKQTTQEAWWPAERDQMLDFEADVSPEATAFAMRLLSHQRKNSALLPKAALWLVNHRNEGYWWSSSKQTAMVIYGLLDYLTNTNELTPDFTATVHVNGLSVATQRFASESAFNGAEIFLDESKLRSGSNQISITTEGAGRLYYSIQGTHYSNAARMEKQAAVSLNILRDYFRLVPAREGDHIVYDLAPLQGEIAAGDILATRLTVTGSEWRYLLTEDPIPAGTEFIERDNLYQLRSRPPWWEYYFDRRELHDDHMAIFQSYFGQGQQQYFYLLKVVNPGSFHVGPARVAPMYQPGAEATTESTVMHVGEGAKQ